jgi:hypothetical protein
METGKILVQNLRGNQHISTLAALVFGPSVISMPEIIDPVFTKISQKCSFSMTAYERSGLFSRKRRSINSGNGKFQAAEF